MEGLDDPDRELIEPTTYQLVVESTKRYGPIPKISFRPNSLAVKEEIMDQAGYAPVSPIDHWRDKREAGACAFDKTWDSIMFQLVKAGRRLAIVNQIFTTQDQDVSDIVRALQQCLEPEPRRGPLPAKPEAPDIGRKSSYADELARLE